MTFSKSFLTFSTLMCVYGSYRGYNVQETTKKTLRAEVFVNTIFNGLLYSAPVFNIVHIVKLVNRIEIEYSGLNKHDYIFNYKEINGTNMNMI